MPRMARLLLSVAPLVKTISLASAPMAAAMDCSSRVDCFAGFVAECVTDAAGVAVLRREVGQHGLDDAGIDSGRGVVVHVDGLANVCHRLRRRRSIELPSGILCWIELVVSWGSDAWCTSLFSLFFDVRTGSLGLTGCSM